MTETLTIPAHIENGTLRLDAPLPSNIERIEVKVTLRTEARSGLTLVKFLEGLPPGTRSRDEIDAEIREGRGDDDR